MNQNLVFFGGLLCLLGIVFMILYRFLAGNVNLQFFYYKNPLMTPESSYGKKWGRVYVFVLGVIAFLIGVFLIIFGYIL